MKYPTHPNSSTTSPRGDNRFGSTNPKSKKLIPKILYKR